MQEPGSPNHHAIGPGLALPVEALRFTFARGGGPGGQHVNKVATRATLTVALDDLAAVLPPWALRRLPPRYLTGDALVISSSEHRGQAANRRDCLAKLRAAVTAAMHRPRYRKPTGPSRASIQRRLDHKKRRGLLKRNRGADRNPSAD